MSEAEPAEPGQRVRERGGLSVDELAGATSGADFWHTTPLGDVAPALMLSDGPHGIRRQAEGQDSLGIGSSLPATCFPPAVALSCTWNPMLLGRIGEALAEEARALGVQVVLGPGMNIKRSPLCGRNFEYFSEDPHLTARLASAMISGIQSRGVAATPKHFAVNNQETDRMRVDAQVGERALREIYLAAFEYVVREARPWALMTAYNRVNGRYASENHWLLTELLRGEWGFDGLVVSDWGAINDRVASLAAGCDLEMPPSDTDPLVVAAVSSGALALADLNRACDRLAVLARRVSIDEVSEGINQAAHDDLARAAAVASVVLLENRDSTLPLTADGGLRIAVIGEFAAAPRFQGGGSSSVVPITLHNPLEEIKRVASGGNTVSFAAGFSTEGSGAIEESALADEAVTLAQDSDVAILFLGLPLAAESEGFDRTHLDLPAAQCDLLRRVSESPARVIVVLSNGGVVSVAPWRDQVDALVEGWLLGQAGGAAIADVLFGLAEPSGRLSETIPLRLEDTSAFPHFPGTEWQSAYAEGNFVGYRCYETVGRTVAYPFGYGLGYTTFAYSDLECRETGPNSCAVSVTVANTGSRPGTETVQVYTGPVESIAGRPIKELRAFQQVTLAPGEAGRVTISLSARDFAFWSERTHGWRVSAGTCRIHVGPNVRDIALTDDLALVGDGIREPVTLDSTLNEWREDPVGAEVIGPMIAVIRAALGDGAEPMLRMGRDVPLRKFANFRMGVTAADLEKMQARAGQLTAQQRSAD